MKTLFLTVSLVVLSFFSTNASNSLLFPQYEEGYAILRGGGRAVTQFNYDKAQQRMLFIDNEGRSMLLMPSNVIAVVIGGRTFIPSGDNDAFKERILINDNALFVRHRVDVRTYTSTPIAYGISVGSQITDQRGAPSHSATGNVTVLTSTPTGTAAGTYLRDQSAVFTHNGNRFVEINSLRSLTRQFNRAQRSQIEDFARRYNISFRNIENVKAITAYALSL